MIIPNQFKGKKFKKAAMFTDIHFGKHSNSNTHNQDCLDFIDWFIENVKKDPEIDHIIFLGDWNENRSALNISTLNYSYMGAKKLNSIGLPVFFLVGNHDLYQRTTRDIHSVVPFNEFNNFILIDNIVYFEEVGKGTLFCPFLFHDEYKELQKYKKVPVWFGHFEFKGYEVTGYGIKMTTGPDAGDFKGPIRIFTGHFHKRQVDEVVCYIGNAFPMDFGDTGDLNRGMAIYNHENNELKFNNWSDCPKYVKVNLSSLIQENIDIDSKSRVKCVVDVSLKFEETAALKQKFQKESGLREFVLEESSKTNELVTDTESSINIDDVGTLDDFVIKMLQEIKSEEIDSEILIKIYKELVV